MPVHKHACITLRPQPLEDRPTLFIEIIQRHNNQACTWYDVIWTLTVTRALAPATSRRCSSQLSRTRRRAVRVA